jgi:hypothetical protein
MPGITGGKRLMRLPGHRAGHPGRVRISDIAALPVQAGAAMRHRRLFHPIGVLANGTIERIAPTGEGLPVVPGEVVGRVSKGVGLPGALPDIAGLAWRMPAPLPPSIPWDVLLASTTGGALGRILLRPVTSWSGTTFSTLMPLGFRGGVWWLRARLATLIEVPGLSLDTIADQIGRSGIDFDIEQAAGTGDFQPLARLSLREVVPLGRDLAFDPTLHSAPGVNLLPGWLTDFRRAAYRRSRQGRGAE